MTIENAEALISLGRLEGKVDMILSRLDTRDAKDDLRYRGLEDRVSPLEADKQRRLGFIAAVSLGASFLGGLALRFFGLA